MRCSVCMFLHYITRQGGRSNERERENINEEGRELEQIVNIWHYHNTMLAVALKWML